MPETYTGTEGTDALNAGYDVLDGTEDRRDGWLAINKTRDYLAALKTWVLDQIAAMQAKVDGIQLAWDKITGKPATYPPAAHTHTSLDEAGRRFGTSPDVGGAPGWGTGENVGVFGHLYVPNATPASSGYTVAYINNDGRLSKGASSERYKRDITPITPADLGDLWPQLVTYIIRDDPTATPRVGYIAERLAENTDQQPFVVYDNDNRPDSIDFIALLIAQNAQLHQRVSALEAGHASN